VNRLRIVVAGMMAGDPGQGGATWAVLQYVLGLRELGHDVYFVEPLNASAAGRVSGLGQPSIASYFTNVMRDFGLTDRAALIDDQRQTIGMPFGAVQAVCRSADVLFNISGMLTDGQLFPGPRTRVYVDLDPVFNQLWHAVQGVDRHFDGHTHFVTIGQSIGALGSQIPDCGYEWIRTWQPIVLSKWPVADAIAFDALTTIANWRAYGSIEANGRLYGQKAHSLRQYMDLPTATTERFALALTIHPDEVRDLAALREHRWELLNPAVVAGTPASYQRFVQGSKAEFGIAKSGYVVADCGWFSDRSICYLASGRPVIAQDTGFTRDLPVGDGLFAFRSRADVLSAIDALNTDYHHHRRHSRALAEEFFDSRKVLSRLLDQVAGS